MSADATCSTMESYSNSSARVPESSGNREDRLQRRRERERARRASETAEQREERLRVRRARDRARCAAQTAEERDARLRQIRDNRRQSLATESEEERAVRLQQMRDRLASETEEERAARLQRMSANQRHRLASETEKERAARLQRMSANQRHRLATETEEEREARLQRNSEGQRGQQSQLPLFEQPSVQAKMRNFHAEIAALEMQKCTTCSEAFPGLQLRSHSIAFELTLAPTMLCIHLVHILGIHIVQMTSLHERPRLPSYTFYVPNPCILGTRPVLPYKNGSCCKLALVGTKSVFVLCYSRYLSAVGCSQVKLSYW